MKDPEPPVFSVEEAPDGLSGYGEPADLPHIHERVKNRPCAYHLGVLLQQAITQLEGTPQQASAIRQAIQLLYQLPTRRL